MTLKLFSRKNDSRISKVHLSVIKTPQPLRIVPISQISANLSLLAIMPISHHAIMSIQSSDLCPAFTTFKPFWLLLDAIASLATWHDYLRPMHCSGGCNLQPHCYRIYRSLILFLNNPILTWHPTLPWLWDLQLNECRILQNESFQRIFNPTLLFMGGGGGFHSSMWVKEYLTDLCGRR